MCNFSAGCEKFFFCELQQPMFNNAVESELIALESVRNEIFHFNILSNIQNTHREMCSLPSKQYAAEVIGADQ